MLVGTPLYAPTILYSQNRMRSGRTLKTSSDAGVFGVWQPGIYRLVHVLEGQHRVDLIGQSFVAPPESVYMLPPGMLHMVTLSPGSLARSLGFIVVRVPGAELIHEQGMAYRLADTKHQQPDPQEIWGKRVPVVFDVDLAAQIRDDLALIVSIAWRDPWHRCRADQLLGRILWTMATQNETIAMTGLQHGEAEVPWTQGFEQLLEQHMQTVRTTGDLAALVGLSTDHFAKVFTKIYGCSPAKYLRTRRLQVVARYLSETTMKLQDIASLVGFRDATALSHVWRTEYDLSPNRWRRQQRQGTNRSIS
jgi:AraC-like DNA-binding protein